MWFISVIGLRVKPSGCANILSIRLSRTSIDSKRILHTMFNHSVQAVWYAMTFFDCRLRPTWEGSWTGMDRKECYRLTHPLSKMSGYATDSQSNPTKKLLRIKRVRTTHALRIRLIELWMSRMNWELGLRSINCYELVGYFWATARTLVKKKYRVAMTSFIHSATDCD